LRSGHEGGQVPNPYTKLTGTDTLRVIGRILEDAKHIFDKKIRNRKGHAGESPHKKAGRVGKILIKRGETILDCVHPRIAMIKHVDQNDAQRPYIGGTGLIHGSHVVPAFIAHIRSATTVHVRRDGIAGGEAKVRQFDNDLPLTDTVLVED
jgi:hypothetical protein